MRPTKAYLRVIILVFILSLYGLFFAQGINLVIADLGRHLKNGEIFFQGLSVPYTNLYSYTYPGFPFLNHHWGSGVIFYLVERLSGFNGLSIFYIILQTASLFLFFHIAWKYSHFELAALISLVTIPVLGSRTEIRPEVFTYFFSGVFCWILWNYRYGRLRWPWLILLPVSEIIWINTHIYFFIGPFLVGMFLLECLFVFYTQKKQEMLDTMRKLAAILALTVLAACINPAGPSGAFYPFLISKNYIGYAFENQSFYAIEKEIMNKLIIFSPQVYFRIILALLAVSWIFACVKILRRRANFQAINFILTVTFAWMALSAIRNFVLLGYFALPIAAINLRGLIREGVDRAKAYFIVFILGALILWNLFLINPQYWPRLDGLGLGLNKDTTGAIDFFKRNNIQGRIMNNFDIGSYLIYYLYPQHRVFIDNRPEAYPVSFFKETYIPMQEDDSRWREEAKRYNFGVIFFFRKVLTPWGQDFLIRRVFDPLWAPVYVDEYCIMLLKRNGPDQSTVEKFEIPRELFTVKKLR